MNFKDFIDNSLQELHQLRQLKEEQQQGFDVLYYFWFGLVNGRFGAAEYNGIGGLGASATWGGGFFGLQRMYGLPQAMLDMFDYNGDGLIGYNDQALIREIGQLAIEIYNETGEFPPVITAADYLQNWAYYRVLYGKDFPDPNGYAGYPGSDSEVPDSLITSNTEGNSIFGWAGAQNFWRSLNLVLDKQALIEYYGQELIDQIFAVYDLDGDGQITGYALGNATSGDAGVWQMLYTLSLRKGLDVRVDQMPSPSELKDVFYNFSMFGDVSLADLYYERYGVYPEGDYQYYDPTYGQNQAPPPPEETPQAQAPRPEIGGLE